MKILEEIKKSSREEKLVFLAISYSFISSNFASTLISPFFPAEAEKHGVGKALLGSVFTVKALLGVVFGPFIGMLVAAIGPKACFLLGISMNSIFIILFGLLETAPSREWFVAGSFICLGLSSLGDHILGTTTLTYAAKLFPKNLNLTIGTLEFYIAISEMVALSTGGLIHDLGGFKLPYILFGCLHLLSIPLNIYLLPPDEKGTKSVPISGTSPPDSEKSNECEVENTNTAKSPENTIRPWHLLLIPRAVLLGMVVMTTEITWAFLDTTLERHLAPLGLTSTQTTSMFLITTVGYGVTCPLWGYLADKITRTWAFMSSALILAGLGFYLIGPLPFLGLENTIWLNVVSLFIITLAIAAANVPVCEAVMICTVEAGHADGVATYAMVASMISTSYQIGSAIGSFSAGFLVEGIGYSSSAAVYGSISISYGFIILLHFLCCYKPKKELKMRDLSLRRLSRRGSQAYSSPGVLAQELNGEIGRVEENNPEINIPLKSV